jgi:hypothetical protein
MTTTMGNPGGGFDPVTHQSRATVVQQDRAGIQTTLMAFVSQYDAVGKLTGISDWRGRGEGTSPRLGLEMPHPTDFETERLGHHQASYPAYFDRTLAGPTQWNSSDVVAGTLTGWPVGAAPSDAKLGYDTLYQLVSEDREYITANGADSQLDGDYKVVQERVRSLDWSFDPAGSMTEWLDGEDSSGNMASTSLGRALGRIENGYQLNQKTGNTACMNALAGGDTIPAGCYKPEAVYFASNTDDLPDGQGTCIWASYDAGAG